MARVYAAFTGSLQRDPFRERNSAHSSAGVVARRRMQPRAKLKAHLALRNYWAVVLSYREEAECSVRPLYGTGDRAQ